MSEKMPNFASYKKHTKDNYEKDTDEFVYHGDTVRLHLYGKCQ